MKEAVKFWGQASYQNGVYSIFYLYYVMLRVNEVKRNGSMICLKSGQMNIDHHATSSKSNGNKNQSS